MTPPARRQLPRALALPIPVRPREPHSRRDRSRASARALPLPSPPNADPRHFIRRSATTPTEAAPARPRGLAGAGRRGSAHRGAARGRHRPRAGRAGARPVAGRARPLRRLAPRGADHGRPAVRQDRVGRPRDRQPTGGAGAGRHRQQQRRALPGPGDLGSEQADLQLRRDRRAVPGAAHRRHASGDRVAGHPPLLRAPAPQG